MTTDIERPAGVAEELAPAGRPRAGEEIRLFAMVALTVLLLALSVVVAVPFLPSITWAVALAILAWPMHVRLRRVIPWPSVAAGLSTTIVVVALVGIGGFVVYNLAAEAGAAVQHLEKKAKEGGGVEATVAEEVPLAGRAIDWLEDRGVDVEGQVRRLASASAQYISGFTQVSAVATIQFLVASFILFYLFRDPRAFLSEIQDLLPMPRSESDFVIKRAGDSIHANLYATLITGLLNASSYGLLFWWFGLPAPLLWTVIMFVLCVLPILGAGLVWGPAAVYLAMNGQWVGAIVLVGWGVLTFIIVGYFLYGRIVGERMKMHDVPALLAFLGGLAVFGLSGMILGPAIVAVTMALIDVWKHRMAASEARAVATRG